MNAKLKLNMRAYYFGFKETGTCEIDQILSGVACAGKAHHHTQDWNEKFTNSDLSHISLIQIAAEKASEEMQNLRTANRDLMDHFNALKANYDALVSKYQPQDAYELTDQFERDHGEIK